MDKRKNTSEWLGNSQKKPKNNETRNDDGAMTKRYGIGAKLLSQMGYQSGQGLGVNSSGIVNPIEPTQTQSSSNRRVGLGMLSLSQAINDDEYFTSSEEEDILKNNVVTFKMSKENQSGTLIDSYKTDIVRKLNNLKLNGVLDIEKEDDSKFLTEFQEKFKISSDLSNKKEDIVSRLTNINSIVNQLNLLEKQIPLLENDILEVKEYRDILANLRNNNNADKFIRNVNEIMKLSNNNLVDRLISEQVRQTFSDFDWNINDNKSLVLTSLNMLIELLKYRFDIKDGHLNRTQTEIFKVIYNKLIPYLESFEVSNENSEINFIITLLIDFETILSYINCYSNILDTYIIPKLISGLNKWNLSKDNEPSISPRNWMFDFIIVIDSTSNLKLQEIVQNKLVEFCKDWDYKKSKALNLKDLIFFNEFLNGGTADGNKFYEISRKYFLHNFLGNFWESYFDPFLELEEFNDIVNESQSNSDSLVAIRTLRSYAYLFHPTDYKIIIKSTFNEINKILYQWLLYAEDSNKVKAISWFKWFINNSYQDPLAGNVELSEIRKTDDFLRNWEKDKSKHIVPIHDETFDLYEELKTVQSDIIEINDESDVNSDIHNIPMRKVLPTFREVVEDYCEEHGYQIEKLANKYTELDYGKNRSSLVPIFKISNDMNKSRYIAIKDDILWVRQDDDKYVPMYLLKLEL